MTLDSNKRGNVRPNVTLRRVRVTIVAIIISYSECVPVALAMQQAAHPPYRHLWHVWLYNSFPHYPIKGTIFRGGVTEHTCVF